MQSMNIRRKSRRDHWVTPPDLCLGANIRKTLEAVCSSMKRIETSENLVHWTPVPSEAREESANSWKDERSTLSGRE